MSDPHRGPRHPGECKARGVFGGGGGGYICMLEEKGLFQRVVVKGVATLLFFASPTEHAHRGKGDLQRRAMRPRRGATTKQSCPSSLLSDFVGVCQTPYSLYRPEKVPNNGPWPVGHCSCFCVYLLAYEFDPFDWLTHAFAAYHKPCLLRAPPTTPHGPSEPHLRGNVCPVRARHMPVALPLC